MSRILSSVPRVNDFLAGWIQRPMSRENRVALRSTQAEIERVTRPAVVECRLPPIDDRDPFEEIVSQAARRPPEPSACGTAPRLSPYAITVHHEATIIRVLGRALHTWISLADRHETPLSEGTCCEFVRLLMDIEAHARREQTDGE